jgi:hypothetical protein
MVVLQGNWDAGDDVAQNGLGLFAGRDVPFGVRSEADAVCEEGDGEIVNVVGDAVGAALQEGAGASRA